MAIRLRVIENDRTLPYYETDTDSDDDDRIYQDEEVDANGNKIEDDPNRCEWTWFPEDRDYG